MPATIGNLFGGQSTNATPTFPMRHLKPFFSCFAILTLFVASGCRTPAVYAPSGKLLLEADTAFARAAARDGVAQAFRDYAARDGMILPQGAKPVTGPNNIFQLMLQNRGDLTWTARGADISRS